ncbi:MAG: iron-containing alcohol dehydrogenase family protein, partial [Gaiellales bacterium]
MSPTTALLAYHAPVRILYGSGLTATAGAESVATLPSVRRALLVTDVGVRDAGITERVEDALAAAAIATVTTAVAGEPTEGDVARGAELLGEHGADVIVGVGGGSALDAGKAMNVAAHNDGEIRSFEGFDRIPNPGLPFVSVPTTAGTGSEVGCGMVVADTGARRKYLIVDKKYWPALALLDPDLTVSLPPRATAWSGIDALAQAMGALVVTLAHPLMEPTGLGAVRLLGRNLVAVVEDGSDTRARLAMQLGSALAGFAMYNAEAGLDHAFGEVVGGRFGVPHGASIAMFLPETTAFTVPAAEEMYARIAREISPDWTRLPDAAACERLVAWLSDLNAGFGIPSLGTFGAAEADIPELVHLTLEHFSASINPRQLRIEDAEAIYRVAL